MPAPAPVPPVPFDTREVSGAHHMLVAFPSLDDQQGKPATHRGRRVAALHAHRLHVAWPVGLEGLPQHAPVTAAIQAEAQRLRIPLQNVIAYGTSFTGSFALWAGLHAGLSRIVVGAPIVKLGTRLRPRTGPDVAPIAPHHAKITSGADAWGELDRVIELAAHGAGHHCDVHVFVSPSDYAFRDCLRLHEQLVAHPTIRSHLIRDTYSRHSDVVDPFYEHLVALLSEEAGVPVVPDVTSSAAGRAASRSDVAPERPARVREPAPPGPAPSAG